MKTKLFENSEQLIMININNYNLKIIIAIEFRNQRNLYKLANIIKTSTIKLYIQMQKKLFRSYYLSNIFIYNFPNF